MDLHKQVFNQEVGTPRANMATPVELPGDKVCALPAAHLPLPLPLLPFAPSSSSPFLLPRSAVSWLVPCWTRRRLPSVRWCWRSSCAAAAFFASVRCGATRHKGWC